MHSVPLHVQNGKPRLQDAHKSTHESCNLIRAHNELCLAEIVQNPYLITRSSLPLLVPHCHLKRRLPPAISDHQRDVTQGDQGLLWAGRDSWPQ